MKIVLAQINPTVGDLEGNFSKILRSIQEARKQKADLVLFPELALVGYPPEDFLLLPHFEKAVSEYLQKIVDVSEEIAVVVGLFRTTTGGEKRLCNTAAVISNKKLLGFQDKMLLPTYDVFDERRYFEPATQTLAWDLCGKKIGITICEDIWEHGNTVHDTDYRHDPIMDLKKLSLDYMLNLSASPFRVGKALERFQVSAKAAQTLECPVLLCNQVGGNDSLIFDGCSLYVGADGSLLKQAKSFQEDHVLIDLDEEKEAILYQPDDLHQALVLGIADYFKKSGFSKACLGLSGGIDSAVVACLAVEALGKENVLAVIMPSRYSTESSFQDAEGLIQNLGIKKLEISIEKPFQTYLDLLQPHFQGHPPDATEENLQARIRGTLLMAISNKLGYIVLSTGNKSELAMGYATLYGDMCGGLAVLSDVTKKQVYELAKVYKNLIPPNTITKEPSAELRPGQKDSDTLPPYDIVDNVLHDYVVSHLSPEEIAKNHGYSLDLVHDLIKRIHKNEYKRRQSAPGLRISQKAFSVGRRFPIVQKFV